MFPRNLSRVVSRVKSGASSECEEGSENNLVFIRTWDRDTFHRVCVAVLSKYSGEFSRESAISGQFLSVVGPSVSFASLVGGSHVHRNTYI